MKKRRNSTFGMAAVVLLINIAVLLAGVCADHALSPVLLRLALERVLS